MDSFHAKNVTVHGFEHVKVLDRADSDSALKTMVNYIYDTLLSKGIK